MHVSPSLAAALSPRGYKPLRSIASGAFGQVIEAVRLADGRHVAIKIVPLKTFSPSEPTTKMIAREIDALASVRHPHIIEFIESFTEVGVLGDENKGPADVVFIVTEYLQGGDLFDRISKKLLSEAEALELSRQLLSALTYMQSKGICHRDLKLENVCLVKANDGRLTAKLIDFGYARPVSGEASQLQETGRVGTLNYYPPQVARGEAYNPFKMDMWSLGVVLYAAMCGRFPFYGQTRQEIEKMIQSQAPSFEEAEWQTVSPQMVRFLKMLMERDESDRISMRQAASFIARIRKSTNTATSLKAGCRKTSPSVRDGRPRRKEELIGIAPKWLRRANRSSLNNAHPSMAA